jgi:WD40 repeat protein
MAGLPKPKPTMPESPFFVLRLKNHHDTGIVYTIALNPTGTLLASGSKDHQVRIWRLSDRRTIAILKHTTSVYCVTFSTDGRHILSGEDFKISKWAVPLLENLSKDQASDV